MRDINKLNIYIITNDKLQAEVFKNSFADQKLVTVICNDIRIFYKENKDKIDCLVSPANAFGYMTGGYDAALSDILGWDFQLKVRDYIKTHFYGEQVVGTSFIIDTCNNNLKLIHTPTMRYPSIIDDNYVIYHCMRSTLICALENDVKNIVIPIFGGSCGGVDAKVAALMMKSGYVQIKNKIGAKYNI